MRKRTQMKEMREENVNECLWMKKMNIGQGDECE